MARRRVLSRTGGRSVAIGPASTSTGPVGVHCEARGLALQRRSNGQPSATPAQEDKTATIRQPGTTTAEREGHECIRCQPHTTPCSCRAQCRAASPGRSLANLPSSTQVAAGPVPFVPASASLPQHANSMSVSFEDVMRVVTTISALCMCASPSTSVYRIHRSRDVGSAAVLPFATLWVCNHIWMLYGFVTGNEFPVLTTYAIGDALSVAFLAVYIRWTTERAHVLKTCAVALLCNIVVTGFVVLGDQGALPLPHQTVTLVTGVVAVASSLALYASPLAAIRTVIQTRSSASLPFAMILAGAINNLLWVVYGVMAHDMFLLVPAMVNSALGLVQVALYGVYHPSRGGANTATLPCQTPKDEPPFAYSVMEPDTVTRPVEVCKIAIDDPARTA